LWTFNPAYASEGNKYRNGKEERNVELEKDERGVKYKKERKEKQSNRNEKKNKKKMEMTKEIRTERKKTLPNTLQCNACVL
jgi:hypothetical protein